MRTPESWLAEIERLRSKHTQLFREEKWLQMQTVGGKIRNAWAGYHAAVATFGTPTAKFKYWIKGESGQMVSQHRTIASAERWKRRLANKIPDMQCTIEAYER